MIHQFTRYCGGVDLPFFGEPEECGLTHRDNGQWVDCRGNTGTLSSWLPTTEDSNTLRTAYCGADTLLRTEDNYGAAVDFLVREAGLAPAVASEIVESWFTDSADCCDL